MAFVIKNVLDVMCTHIYTHTHTHIYLSMLHGSIVTMAWCDLRLQVEEIAYIHGGWV